MLKYDWPKTKHFGVSMVVENIVRFYNKICDIVLVQYFIYIVLVRFFFVEETGIFGANHRPQGIEQT